MCSAVCVCLFVCTAPSNCGKLDLENSFFALQVHLVRSSAYIKVIGSRSRSQEQKSVSVCLEHLQTEVAKLRTQLVYITIQWDGGGGARVAAWVASLG